MFSTSIYYYEKPNQRWLTSIDPFRLTISISCIHLSTFLPTFKESKLKSKMSIGRRSTHHHTEPTKSKHILIYGQGDVRQRQVLWTVNAKEFCKGISLRFEYWKEMRYCRWIARVDFLDLVVESGKWCNDWFYDPWFQKIKLSVDNFFLLMSKKFYLFYWTKKSNH